MRWSGCLSHWGTRTFFTVDCEGRKTNMLKYRIRVSTPQPLNAIQSQHYMQHNVAQLNVAQDSTLRCGKNDKYKLKRREPFCIRFELSDEV